MIWDLERALDEIGDAHRDHAADLEAEGVCPSCEGAGGIAYHGRVQSLDPRDWDVCPDCEGSGRVEVSA